MLKFHCLMATLLLSCVSTAWAQFEQSREVDYPRHGVALGNGWSTLRANKTPGRCIEFAEVPDLSQDRTLDMRRIFDKEQLNRELNVSVEFQAKSIGGVDASAKALYSKSLEVKNEALNLLLSAKVQQGARFVTAKPDALAVQLEVGAAELARTDMASFLATCGDSFVAAMHSGGELNAFLSFDVASMDDREAISTSMAASGLAFAGSVSMSQTLRRYSQSQKLRIQVHSSGGSGEPIPVSEEELLESVRTLPAAAKLEPKPYRITIVRYDTLPNWPKAELSAISFSKMDQLVGQYHRYSLLYYTTQNILQHPSDYIFRGDLTIDSVRKLQDELRLTIVPSLDSAITECLAGKACDTPTTGAALDYAVRAQLPVRINSFTEDTQLRQLESDRASAEAAHTAAPDIIWIDLSVGKRIQFPNPEKPKLKQRLDGLVKAIDVADAAYPAALANAMYKQWIEFPSSSRCISNPVWDYCLSQNKLADYRKRIAVSVEKYTGALYPIGP